MKPDTLATRARRANKQAEAMEIDFYFAEGTDESGSVPVYQIDVDQPRFLIGPHLVDIETLQLMNWTATAFFGFGQEHGQGQAQKLMRVALGFDD